jgi:hypothetical protein
MKSVPTEEVRDQQPAQQRDDGQADRERGIDDDAVCGELADRAAAQSDSAAGEETAGGE